LVSRQIGYQEEEEDETEVKAAPPVLAGVYQNDPLVPGLSLEDEEFVGFNGRCNKNADTCYAYWVSASLDVRIFPETHMMVLISPRCLAKIRSGL